MKIKVLIFVVCLLQISFVSCLKCFLCSTNDGQTCPTPNASAEAWVNADNTKYQSIAPDTVISCAIGYSTDTGTVYFQSGPAISVCSSSTFQSKIIGDINLRGSGGAVQCCSKDGCNWNASTAQNNQDYAAITNKWYILQPSNNQDYAAITNKWYILPDIVNWGPIIISVVAVSLIFLCCCIICCFLCCRKRKKGKKTINDGRTAKPLYDKNRLTPSPIPAKQIPVKSTEPSPVIEPRKKRPSDNLRPPAVLPNPDVVVLKPKVKSVANDPLDDKKKNIFDREQSDWVEIWKNANDPNFKGPLSKTKKYLK